MDTVPEGLFIDVHWQMFSGSSLLCDLSVLNKTSTFDAEEVDGDESILVDVLEVNESMVL